MQFWAKATNQAKYNDSKLTREGIELEEALQKGKNIEE